MEPGPPPVRAEVPGPAPSGLVVVDKPSGWTSHDVVARLRRLLSTRKVGHAGTLDPLATGVLVCGVGRGTKLLGHLALTDKEYLATIVLGSATSTDDIEGEVVWRGPRGPASIDEVELGEALQQLTGSITQVPSSVSAVKVDGRRAYARVRAGEQVRLAGRQVQVSRLDLLGRRDGELDVRVACSTGTYVRALARDLGQALGCGGHLSALRRTRVGPFELAGALALGDVAPASVIPLDQAVAITFPRRDLDAEQSAALRHGRPLPAGGEDGPVGAFAPGGEVLALLQDRDGLARPLVVFSPA